MIVIWHLPKPSPALMTRGPANIVWATISKDRAQVHIHIVSDIRAEETRARLRLNSAHGRCRSTERLLALLCCCYDEDTDTLIFFFVNFLYTEILPATEKSSAPVSCPWSAGINKP
jgi:hypothetical protein